MSFFASCTLGVLLQLLGSKGGHGLNEYGAPRWDGACEKRDGEELSRPAGKEVTAGP